MIKKILLMITVISVFLTVHAHERIQEKQKTHHINHPFINALTALISPKNYCPLPLPLSLDAIQDMLQKEAASLHLAVIHKVLTIIKCADQHQLARNQILTIIDYSLSAREKRLWVFDLAEKKLLFHTYVSHGIKSGELLTTWFSNKYDSKSSSLGVYKTEKTYYGRDGLSLKLNGLESGFNDHAYGRSIVMHGGWYVDEQFINKYGRSGRSWGCPALPIHLTAPILNTIKDNSLFIIYYPNDHWFLTSKFLTCDFRDSPKNNLKKEATTTAVTGEMESRDNVLLANPRTTRNHSSEPFIVVMAADNYEQTFHEQAPLKRMLRRQINSKEYIALSDIEFQHMIEQSNFNAVHFVTPVIKMTRGYYATYMEIVNLGKIKEVKQSPSLTQKADGYTVYFETTPSIHLSPTHQFIRWLGL